MNQQRSFNFNHPGSTLVSQQAQIGPGRRDYFANVANNMIIRPSSNTVTHPAQSPLKNQLSMPNYKGISPSTGPVSLPARQMSQMQPSQMLQYNYPSYPFFQQPIPMNPSMFPVQPMHGAYPMPPMGMPYYFYPPGLPSSQGVEPKRPESTDKVEKKGRREEESGDDEEMDPKIMLMMKMFGVDNNSSWQEDKEMEKMEQEKEYFEKISKTMETQNKIIEELYGSISNLKKDEKDYERKKLKKKAKKLQQMIDEQKMIHQHQDFYNDLKSNMDNYVNELMKIVRVNQGIRRPGEEMDELTHYVSRAGANQPEFAPNPMNPVGLPLNMMMMQQPFQ